MGGFIPSGDLGGAAAAAAAAGDEDGSNPSSKSLALLSAGKDEDLGREDAGESAELVDTSLAPLRDPPLASTARGKDCSKPKPKPVGVGGVELD